jgi:steroid delta-isomerase-like uncharacterized protein
VSQYEHIVKGFWRAFESGDLDAAADFYADDGVMVQAGMPPITGRDAVRGVLAAWRKAFPDVRHEVVDVVEAGDTVAVELRVRGTHTGPMAMPTGQEIPATGRVFTWESVDWIKVRDGKVAAWRVYHDNVPFLTNLGLLPEPAAAPAA